MPDTPHCHQTQACRLPAAEPSRGTHASKPVDGRCSRGKRWPGWDETPDPHVNISLPRNATVSHADHCEEKCEKNRKRMTKAETKEKDEQKLTKVRRRGEERRALTHHSSPLLLTFVNSPYFCQLSSPRPKDLCSPHRTL